mmetsp:Transcript_16818/g.23735  ORF Transcript_16818/g.23735 Transcript_16818/m.23735 type:complete len:190 (-) Transcript_16818:124-693(-)
MSLIVLFHAMMLGQLAETSDPNTLTDETMLQFIEAVKTQLFVNNKLQKEVYEIFMGRVFGIKTKRYNVVKDSIAKTIEIGTAKARIFMEKKRRGDLDEYKKNSWFANAIDRQAKDGSGVSQGGMINLSMSALGAAVDTTSSYMAWNLLHVDVNPEVQECLCEELSAVTQETNGKLMADVFERSQTFRRR